MTLSTFEGLGLAEPLLRALDAENYTTPTPIQAQAIPNLIEGKDLLGIAQTGTGKTAAFALPILHRLTEQRLARQPGRPHALILAPTRELARQIDERFTAYGRKLKLRTAVIFGGVGQGPQVKALAAGVDILIATPGRLLDLHNQRHVKFDQVSILVLDEADRMLDMGFIRDVRKIVASCRKERQTLLFSATMPPDIAKLAAEVLHAPVRVDVSPATVAVERIDQRVYFVPAQAKRTLLTELLADPAMERVLVFTRTKRGADRVCKVLRQEGEKVDALHGDKGQNARIRALESFRDGKARILVATDIAARGIDVSGITHVINYELPNEPESYVHRIGRTARAGAAGRAIAFCDSSERPYLKDIERLMRISIPVESHRLADAAAREPHAERAARSPHAPRQQAPRPHAAKSNGHRPHGSKPHAAKTDGWHPLAKPHAAKPQAAKQHRSDGQLAKPQAAGQQAGKGWAGSRGRRGTALPAARGALARPKIARVSFSGEPR